VTILIPVITAETKKYLGEFIKTDFGQIESRGVLHVHCAVHNVFFDARQGKCLLCFMEESEKSA